jgi:hypothetical protein
MALTDFRMAVGLTGAHRARREFPVAKPSNPAAKLGLRYERNVGKELKRHIMPSRFSDLEHNPWFTFYDVYGMGNCCPDYLLWLDNRVIIIEVKLTWVEVALAKLQELYCPVVSTALECPVLPLVICRNVNRSSPPAQLTLVKALTSDAKLLQWPNIGHIPWQ